MTLSRIAIIGGGAAGFFCAALLAESEMKENLQIILYELLDKPMLKLHATGGGRCNLTHNVKDFKALCKYYPGGEKFLYSVFNQFDVEKTIRWFENKHISLVTDQEGCVFPESNKATTISDCLYKTTQKAHFDLKLSSPVTSISYCNNKFAVESKNETQTFDFVVIASGGKVSINNKIKSYNGYNLAQALGHSITDTYQSIAPIITKTDLSTLAGIVVKNIEVKVHQENKLLLKRTGDILFTHKGLSGPVILDISSYLIDKLVDNNSQIRININFTLFKNIEEAHKVLLEMLSESKNKNIINVLAEIVPKNLSKFIVESNNIDPKKKNHSITKKEREVILNNLVNYDIKGFEIDQASGIVTSGGVQLKEVHNKTLESKITPNLFFAGEILDVDGLCGGFNLQFAWSSAFVAANAIIQKIQTPKCRS